MSTPLADTTAIDQIAAEHQWPGGYYCSCGQELNSPQGFTRHVLDAYVALIGAQT